LRKRHLSGGFTLVELVLAISIGLVLLGAVWTAVWSGQRSSVGIERKVTAGQDARMALEIMAAEIRMASFNPLTAELMWLNPSDCSVAANQQWRGLQEATASSITIEMDLDPDGICGNSGNEIIRSHTNRRRAASPGRQSAAMRAAEQARVDSPSWARSCRTRL